MKLTKFIKVLLFVHIGLLSTNNVRAQCDVGEMEEFRNMLNNSYRAPGGNLGKVRLYFKMQDGYSAESVMARVETAMRVRDPNGWLNPYWVVAIVDNASCGKEGVLVGKWYTIDGSGFSTWGKYMENELAGIKGISSYKAVPLSN